MTLHIAHLKTSSRSRGASLSTLCRCAVVLAVFFTGAAAASMQEIAGQKARKVEAAYLYNFAKFVHWPESAFEGSDSVVVIGVLGDDPFGDILDDTVTGRKIGARAIRVRRLQWSKPSDRNELSKCHILFVSASERDRFDEILRSIADAPVLVTGDFKGHASAGGTIGFVLEGGRIVFEINQNAAKQSGLKLSAKLLKLARIVETDGSASGAGPRE